MRRHSRGNRRYKAAANAADSAAILAMSPFLRLRGAGYAPGATAVWTDEISGYTFTQSTAASQPTSVSSDSNFSGKPTVSFDGGDFLVSSAAASTWKFLHTAPMTVAFCHRFAVVSGSVNGVIATANTINTTAAGAAFASTNMTIGSGTVNNFGGAYGGAAAGYTNNTTVWLVVKWDGTTGTAKAYNRKSTQSSWSAMNLTGTIGSTDPGATMYIGDYTGGSRKLTGQIAEILVWNRQISDSEGDTVASYFSSTYGAVV